MASKEIIVAVDNSPESLYALDWAIENIHNTETELVILCVLPDPREQIASLAFASGEMALAMADTYQRIEESTLKLKEECSVFLENRCQENRIENFRISIEHGDPRTILEEASLRHPIALVVGSRGLGAIKRTLLGSVSDFCVRHCACPIVTVKLPKSE